MGHLWSAIFPWFVVIPLQTNVCSHLPHSDSLELNIVTFQGALAMVLNWASLIFTWTSNLLFPFILLIVSKQYLTSVILDANVTPKITMAGVPLTLITTLELAPTPAENIPIVIITNSMDKDPDNTEDVKTLMSTASEEAERSKLGTIPMLVMHHVLSPSISLLWEVCQQGWRGLDKHQWEWGGLSVLLLSMSGKETTEACSNQWLSLSISLSHLHSITHLSNTRMDKFLLISPTSST